jgi:hypothetical protein
MAKSNNKTTVFYGRKDKYGLPSAEQLRERLLKKSKNVPSTTKALHNIGRMNKTQRKDVARTTQQLKDRGLQNNLVKQHIGAGIIFNLVSRCEPQVSP